MFWMSGAMLCLGQNPDFAMNDLARVNRTRSDSRSQVSARVQLYSDGESLILYAEVRDPRVQVSKYSPNGDHIEVWFALPVTAYPSGFDYNHHPEYIYAPPAPQSGKGPRFFSIYSEYATLVDVQSFTKGFDYPENDRIRRDSLNLPLSNQLKFENVHFGMVHYALYPDNRPAVLMNGKSFKRLEESLGVKAGNMADGIRYTAEPLDDRSGYVINAQIFPQALGFVTVPELRQVNMLVNIIDGDPSQPQLPALATTEKGVPGKPSTFNTVYLQRPIQCHFAPAPADVLRRLDLRPTYFFSEKGWIPASVATDALVFGENETSKNLNEVRFAIQPINYVTTTYRNEQVSWLEVEFKPVNAIPTEERFLMIRDQVIRTKLVQGSLLASDSIKQSFFSYPDGATGMIVVENSPLDPYGWGPYGNKLEERIIIHRLYEGRLENVLTIVQGDGDRPFCQVFDQSFNDFRMKNMYWVRKGEILVLLMQHRRQGYHKRVKVSWGKNGQKLKIVMID